jgi:hypothetical protein
VTHHQGPLSFETAVGTGTTFIVSIPLAGPRNGEKPTT